jgi:metallo-beta-lactamase family protein
MSKLHFYGASSVVTGSCFVLEDTAGSVLVDLGIFQEDHHTESANTEPLPFSVHKLSCVLITHAHLDHCGRLPLLVKDGYKGAIYMTPATKDIVEISLEDSANIAERRQEEDGIQPIFSQDDVVKVLELIQTVEYDTPTSHSGFSFVFRDAGHILGSASIEVTDSTGNSTIFSGDLGNSPQDIIQPTTLITAGRTAVIESTYGGQKHKTENVYDVLQHEINEVEETNGVLLIPAFSIQRTQEIIHRIGHLLQQNKIKTNTPIFVDSPMAIRVTEVFKNYINLYNAETAAEESPFEFSTLIPTPGAHESKEILKTDGPKVIIAGSGMMNGGRIHFHLKNYAARHNTRILIVGYQAENTLGRQIENGAKRIVLFEEEVTVNASVTKVESMSSHADHPRLMKWLQAIQGLQTVCIVHGEDDRRKLLADDIKKMLPGVTAILPVQNEVIELA